MDSLSNLVLPRLPRRPYCCNDLRHGLVVRPATTAIEKAYLQLNPPVLRHWLIFDLDCEGGAWAWEWANLPPPNWATVNPENGHAHLAYLLTLPVVTTANGRDHPLRYAAAIEAAMTIALGADQAYSGHITKNPLHPCWRTVVFHSIGYSLDELSEYVDLPNKNWSVHETSSLGLMRNLTLFDELRSWAYAWALHFKQAGASFEYWGQALMKQAEVINGNFPNPLDWSEVRATVRSVGKWVWRRFTETEFRKIQSARGVRSGEKRRKGSLEEQQPWAALGISRRTYFNRKKKGTLDP